MKIFVNIVVEVESSEPTDWGLFNKVGEELVRRYSQSVGVFMEGAKTIVTGVDYSIDC